MRDFWIVAKYEYLKIVRQKSFLWATLGIPVLMIVATGVSILITLGQRGDTPLGYVDHADVLADPIQPPLEAGEEIVPMQAFESADAARAALMDEEIQAYYILPETYMQSGAVELIYLDDSPGESVQNDFESFLRANLIKDQPEAVRERLINGATLTIKAIEGSQELDMQNPISFMLPFATAFFFAFAVMTSAGYMLQAVTDEKENRTIEILITSLRAETLIGGKALALMSVGLTQIAIWIGAALLVLTVASPFVPFIQGVSLPWSLMGIIAVFFLPAYTLAAGMMTAIGSIVPDLQQGQQFSGILNLLFVLPFFFVTVLMSEPNHPLIIALSFFPTTSFITITLRWGMATVPFGQLAISWIILVAAAILSVWSAARLFRLGMLRYGQRLTLDQILHPRRGAASQE
ncbi:MAG: ABC transporter permease [Anaerolineales bacterium]